MNLKEAERCYENAAGKVMDAMGTPVMDKVNTSYIERHNLSVRMGNRRFTRLTNGFSKKWDNHRAALAL